MSAGQQPPGLLARSTRYRMGGRVHFPKDSIGDIRPGGDEEYVVFREMVLDPTETQPEKPGAISSVRVRFAGFSARANKRLSLIPAPFIAAQPGFRSKAWMFGRDTESFQGGYEWDSVADAEAYWTSFPLSLMKRRAVPGSITYEVVPK